MVLDAGNQIKETSETNNAGVVPAARRLVDYVGPKRTIQYLDPRYGNREGAAWREFAQWTAGKGVRMRLCAYAPQAKGSSCVALLSQTRTLGFDALTNIGITAQIFAPAIARTSATTGKATVTQTFPAVAIPFDFTFLRAHGLADAAVRVRWVRHNVLTNVLRR